jgi:hypothetical protein
MRGIPMEHSDGERSSNVNKQGASPKKDTVISTETLYNWKKNTAIEIEYLVKDKQSFYNLYLRNSN